MNIFCHYILNLALAANIWSLEKSKIAIVLDINICQVNIEVFQLIKINSLLKILEEKFNNSDQLDNNKYRFFKTLKKSIFLVLQQWQLNDINNLV